MSASEKFLFTEALIRIFFAEIIALAEAELAQLSKIIPKQQCSQITLVSMWSIGIASAVMNAMVIEY